MVGDISPAGCYIKYVSPYFQEKDKLLTQQTSI